MPAEVRTRRRAPGLRLSVDGRRVRVPAGTTVLRAAELAGVVVPSLCAHRELTPFGGCRLCAVEIDGVRGRPLACSTVAEDGMTVTTDSEALREVRREILQLLLAAHPSSCLVCDDQDGCERNQRTTRKVGVSTGCRTCPSDGRCELQRVVAQVGVEDLEYPVSYRGLEAEHDDPFYDRDYNLCILCGRCVRMCQEVRGASVLAFTQRSRRALVGPAFGRSHVEAGCEFCGACVSVCPTGALADKVSKWDGEPDGCVESTCPFCGLGCRLEIAHAGGRLSAAHGAHDAALNDGQLCVAGRFCLPEATHHPARARKPLLRRGGYQRVETWDAALEDVAGRLAECDPGELLCLTSPDLTNESLFAAQRFVRAALHSRGVDSTARDALPGGPVAWSRLFSRPVSLAALAEADAVVVAGLDGRFALSVAAVQVRRAVRRGARLVAVDARETTLAHAADEWVAAPAGAEAALLCGLLAAVTGGHRQEDGGRDGRIAAAARLIGGADRLAVLVGPRVFDALGAAGLVAALEDVAARPGVTVVPLAHGANTRGALELGALCDVLPGPRRTRRAGMTLADVRDGGRPRVLYLVGAAPPAARPDCDYLIVQDLYAPPYPVDAFLPAASFAEAGGTVTNLEGRVQDVRAVEEEAGAAVTGDVRPDWWVFAELARRLGRPTLDFASAADVRAAIRADVPGFPGEGDRSPRRMRPLGPSGRERGHGGAPGSAALAASHHPPGRGRFVLVPEPAAFRHRGFDLAAVVEGLGELQLEDGLRLHPDDLVRMGVGPGELLTVTVDGLDLVLPARADAACARGAVYVTRGPGWPGPVQPRRVRVSAGDRARRSRRWPPPAPPAATRGGGGDGPRR